MGKNTMDRQNFIIDNLVIEEDLAEEKEENAWKDYSTKILRKIPPFGKGG